MMNESEKTDEERNLEAIIITRGLISLTQQKLKLLKKLLDVLRRRYAKYGDDAVERKESSEL